MAVSKGEPLRIRADDWNTLLEVASAQRGAAASIISVSQVPSASGVVVPVKNGTGSTLSRYHAVGIGAPLFTPTDNLQSFKNQLAFNAATMSAAYFGSWAVLQETIDDGKIGMAMVSGVTVAEITVNHADHDRVAVDTAGGTKLVSQFYGAGKILYKESGTGTKWAVIRIGDFVAPELKAIAGGNISAGGSGSVTVQKNGSSSQSVTAYLNWMEGTTGVSTSDELLIRFFEDENKYVIIGAEC